MAPEAIATLLPGLGDLKAITGDENLEAGPVSDHPSRFNREGTIDRPQCWGSISPGIPDAYDVDAISGYHAQEFTDTRSFLSSVQVTQAVAVFHDVPAAQSQLAMEALFAWAKENGIDKAKHDLQPEDLGMRITYLWSEPIDATKGPAGTFAVPYALSPVTR